MVFPALFLAACLSMMMVGVFRSVKKRHTDLCTYAAFGWYLGLIWALAFVAVCADSWGTDNIIGIALGGAGIAILATAGAYIYGRFQPTSRHDILDDGPAA